MDHNVEPPRGRRARSVRSRRGASVLHPPVVGIGVGIGAPAAGYLIGLTALQSSALSASKGGSDSEISHCKYSKSAGVR